LLDQICDAHAYNAKAGVVVGAVQLHDDSTIALKLLRTRETSATSHRAGSLALKSVTVGDDGAIYATATTGCVALTLADPKYSR
jgi:hypothetical protein